MSRYLVDTSFDAIALNLGRQIKTIAGYALKHCWRETPALFWQVSKYKNSKRDRKAFVFANGPSLSLIDPVKIGKLSKDGAIDIFGVNSYISSSFGQIALPTKYVLSDPAHFGMGCADGNIERPKECAQDVARLKNIPGIEIFVPFDFRKKIDPTMRIIPFSDRESSFSSNFTDIRWPRGFCTMTAYKALQVACYLGYEEIFVAGFDNNYFKTITNDSENQLWEVDAHCYDLTGVKRKVTPPAYGCSNMAEYLMSNAMLFRDLYGFPKGRIFNLIPDSLVDAFPKRASLDVYIEA